MNVQKICCSSCQDTRFGHNDTAIRGNCGHFVDEQCFTRLILKSGVEYRHSRDCGQSLKNYTILQLKNDGHHLEIFNTTPTSIQEEALILNQELETDLPHRSTQEVRDLADALFLRESCIRIGDQFDELTYLAISKMTQKERFLRLCLSDQHANPLSRSIVRQYEYGEHSFGETGKIATTAAAVCGLFCCLFSG